MPIIARLQILCFGNCSNIILKNTVIGIAIINPGIPQMKPQNISITKTVIIFIEKDFPIKTGSKILPKSTCTIVIDSTKKNNTLLNSNSTKAKRLHSITVTKDPTICTKLIKKPNSPQKIGKLTSKK